MIFARHYVMMRNMSGLQLHTQRERWWNMLSVHTNHRCSLFSIHDLTNTRRPAYQTHKEFNDYTQYTAHLFAVM